jgi:hypothetical protein
MTEWPRLHIDELVRGLADSRVSYVLVGGAAARLYGVTRPPGDLDICVRWERENVDRLARMLRALDALPADPFGVVYHEPLARAMFLKLLVGMWRTTLGQIDVKLGILGCTPSDLKCFHELMKHSVRTEIAGCALNVASLDDMIISIQAKKRPKDTAILSELIVLRDGHQRLKMATL